MSEAIIDISTDYRGGFICARAFHLKDERYRAYNFVKFRFNFTYKNKPIIRVDNSLHKFGSPVAHIHAKGRIELLDSRDVTPCFRLFKRKIDKWVENETEGKEHNRL